MTVVPAFIRRRLGLSRAVRRMFLGDGGTLNEDAKALLADLKVFCFVDRSTALSGNPELMKILEGRRQVYLRLIDKMKPDHDLWRAIETLEITPDE